MSALRHEPARAMPEVENHLHFIIRQDGTGAWLVIEAHGLAGGLFCSKEAALQFCAFESNRAPGAVEVLGEFPRSAVA